MFEGPVTGNIPKVLDNGEVTDGTHVTAGQLALALTPYAQVTGLANTAASGNAAAIQSLDDRVTAKSSIAALQSLLTTGPNGLRLFGARIRDPNGPESNNFSRPGVLDFQNSLLKRSIALFLKCSPKRQTWHVLGLFPSLWPCVVEGWSGGGRRWSGGGREVVGRWSEVVGVGGGRRVVGRWSEGGWRWSERGRKVVGRWPEIPATSPAVGVRAAAPSARPPR